MTPLQAIQRAGQASSSYSVTISQEFTRSFWTNPTTSPVYNFLFPPVLAALRGVGRRQLGTDSYPVFLVSANLFLFGLSFSLVWFKFWFFQLFLVWTPDS